MYMDDIRLFAKNETEFETLIQTVGIYSQGCIIMTSEKRHLTKGIELPNHEKISIFGGKETNKYLGILEADKRSGDEWKN